MSDFWKRSGFWAGLGHTLAILGIIFAGFQIYQAAAIQREANETDRRTMMAELAMTAHEAAYEFMATVFASPVKAHPTKDETGQLVGDSRAVTNEIRSAGLRLSAAVSRALLVDDLEMAPCLRSLDDWWGTMVEVTLPLGKEYDGENFAVAIDSFPPIVKRYLDGKAPPEQFENMKEEAVESADCPFDESFGLHEEQASPP